MKRNLGLSLQKIKRLYKKQAAETMENMNSRGMLYSGFTITARINNTVHFLREELEKITNYHNSLTSSEKIASFVDDVKNEGQKTLKVFCEQMNNIKVQDQDFIPFQELKNDLEQSIYIKRHDRWISIIMLLVSIPTLIATIATPIDIDAISNNKIGGSSNV